MDRIQKLVEELEELDVRFDPERPVKVELPKSKWLKLIGSISPALEGSISEEGVNELMGIIANIMDQVPAKGNLK